MVPPMQETQKARDTERSKPNGMTLHQERPVTVYYTEKAKKERGKIKTKGEILEEIGKADQKLDKQEGIEKK